MASECVRVGDSIFWDRGYTEHHVLRVCEGYRLERLVDGMTQQEWADYQADNGQGIKLEDLYTAGRISPEEYQQKLSAVQAVVRRMEVALFYDVENELDGYV